MSEATPQPAGSASVATTPEVGIEAACRRAERWLAGLPEWPTHVVHDGVSSHFGPTILSEADCVMHFARHLHAEGIAWEDMHFELGRSKWLFAAPHPLMADKGRWKVDLALVEREALLTAVLPDKASTFAFDACLEFKLASNHWKFGPSYGDPLRTRAAVKADVEKVASYRWKGLCRLGYVVVFEEMDHEFPVDFESEMEREHDVRVRILRGWR